MKSSILNPVSERNVISICLGNPDKIIEVENCELYPDHFGIDANRFVFMAMLYLYSKKMKPEPMAIYEVLSDQTAKNALDEMGGLEYLVLLKDSRVMEDNIKIYCDKVKQAYVRRTLFDICESGKELMLSTSSEKLNPSELVSSIENKLGDLSLQMSTTSEVYKMGEETDEVLAARELSPETIPGLEVGFTEMDKLTNGLMPGDLLVLAAESKTGKSAMLTNWATNLAILGKVPVLYVDKIMSLIRESIVNLMLNPEYAGNSLSF